MYQRGRRKGDSVRALQYFAVALLLLIHASVVKAELSVGDKFPGFKLEAFGGSRSASLEDYKGKVVLVDFWASWCVPCKRAFPVYNGFVKKFADESHSFHILGVSVDDEMADAKEFLKSNSAKFKNVFDKERKLTGRLGITIMPTSYLLKPNGEVAFIHKGFREKDVPKLESEIKQLLSEKVK